MAEKYLLMGAAALDYVPKSIFEYFSDDIWLIHLFLESLLMLTLYK